MEFQRQAAPDTNSKSNVNSELGNGRYLQVKVDERYSYEDVASVMAVTNCYSTTEPHVDAAGDVYIQKIGHHYRVYVYVETDVGKMRACGAAGFCGLLM